MKRGLPNTTVYGPIGSMAWMLRVHIIEQMAISRNAPSLSLDTDSITAALGALPALRYSPPQLFLTVGLPGAGKSTFAYRLAPMVDAVVLESDTLRRVLFAIPVHSPAESARVFRALHAVARGLLRDGYNVIIDATSLKRSDRAPIQALAEATGATMHVLHLVAPEPVIIERLEHRLATGDDVLLADVDVYRSLIDTQEPLTGDFLRIDSSDPTAIDAAMTKLIGGCRDSLAGSAGGLS
jgi:predicted kinase